MNLEVEPHRLTIAEASEAMASGRLGARELVDSCLSRIEARDAEVRAWANLAGEQARELADRADALPRQAREQQNLLGVPLGVKDIFCTKDQPTSAGSRVLDGWRPGYDSTVVARLRDAGAIILGKTNTTEFASGDPAPTRNPLDLAHTPGGSSAGSGAAVGDDMCLGAIGSQTAGSILRPAVYCGAVGFKPTYGAVSLDGVFPLAWSMDHAGPITKTVEDAALLFARIADRGGEMVAEAGWTPTLGVADRYFTDATPAVAAAFDEMIHRLEKAGWRIRPVTLPASFEAGMASATIILPVEVASTHQDAYALNADQYGPAIGAIIETGKRILAESYQRAQRIRRIAAAQVEALFDDIDLLATPTVPAPAPHGLGSTGDPTFLMPFSHFGMPAVTMPIMAQGEHLPVGLQFAGRQGADWRVLQAGRIFERLIPTTDAATRRADVAVWG